MLPGRAPQVGVVGNIVAVAVLRVGGVGVCSPPAKLKERKRVRRRSQLTSDLVVPSTAGRGLIKAELGKEKRRQDHDAVKNYVSSICRRSMLFIYC